MTGPMMAVLRSGRCNSTGLDDLIIRNYGFVKGNGNMSLGPFLAGLFLPTILICSRLESDKRRRMHLSFEIHESTDGTSDMEVICLTHIKTVQGKSFTKIHVETK